MKLLKKHKDILQELIKKELILKHLQHLIHILIRKILDILTAVILENLLTFQRQYDVPLIVPSNEHKIRFNNYDVMIDKKRTVQI